MAGQDVPGPADVGPSLGDGNRCPPTHPPHYHLITSHPTPTPTPPPPPPTTTSFTAAGSHTTAAAPTTAASHTTAAVPTTTTASHTTTAATTAASHTTAAVPTKPKQRRRRTNHAVEEGEDASKRRCVSTACIACRKRKSKCDGNTPACAACAQVYGTECIYDPNSDHRRKGVYKNDFDSLKTRNSTLQTLIEAILNYPEDHVPALVREIRTCQSLDAVAEKITAQEHGEREDDDEDDQSPAERRAPTTAFESHLYGKMGDLRLDDGSVRYIGGTSNLIHLAHEEAPSDHMDEYLQQENPLLSWTNVTSDPDLILHLVNMYFTWHYTFFTTLSKQLFFRDFLLGRPPPYAPRKTHYCTPLLVNAILALGCHFTSHAAARDNPDDSATTGDHFFREAKRLIMENDEHERPNLTTVQALALMSVREAGCGREGRGWVYSGMSFRMACDMGLHLDSSHLTINNQYANGDEHEEDVRRLTFWGSYLFDKCWSNYLGRLPQLPSSIVTTPKFEVFPDEDSAQWIPYTDSGFIQAHPQPSRTRAVALQIARLCEISNDLMKNFYNPMDMDKAKGKAAELKKLSEIHTRLEGWRRELPKELEPKEGGLSSVLVMHMFFQLLFIHLFRPFLKYTQATSPLPANVSPRKLCTQAAAMISKLMRLYKRSYGLRQICNIAVYIAHSACTIHLLNLPDKNAKRDIVHGIKHLEEIAEGWLGARRSLAIINILAGKWKVELPEEATVVLGRTDAKFGTVVGEVHSPSSQPGNDIRPSELPLVPSPQVMPAQAWQPAAAPPLGGPAGSTGTSVATTLPARTASISFKPPPQDANDMQPAHYHSTVDTPKQQPVRNWASAASTGRSSTSLNDMFGGVEQLIRDSQDWAYRDQAQLGAGFGNWNQVEPDASTWTQPPALPMQMPAAAPITQQPRSNGVYVPHVTTSAGPQAAMPSPPMESDLGMASWLNSMNTLNDMAGAYDENEWYQ